MNEESRPARRLPRNITTDKANTRTRRPETHAEREHRYDREVAAVTYRRLKAKAGFGYRFEVPKRLRR